MRTIWQATGWVTMRLARPGQRNQQRPEMMKDDVLDAIEEELMLGKIFEMRLQNRVERQHAGEKRDLPAQRRTRLPICRGQSAAVPPDCQPSG
jgi:hypothetical protein